MAEATWAEAIAIVLGGADGALHATEIAERVLAQGLRTNAGATPSQTVASTISESLRLNPNTPFQRVAPGQFTLRQAGAAPEPAAQQAEGAAAEADAIAEAGALQAFGMFWRRDAVMWSRSKPLILGRQTPGAAEVDFADQVGVYLLHDRDRVIYVGRAADALYTRMRAHTFDRLAGRWDRFSWFGLKTVGQDGKLRDEAPPWSHAVVIETMEALLIETLEPPLNRKRGDNFAAVEYLQVDDPEVEATRQKALLEDLLRRTRA
ncbi:MAG: HTH domain-containing protein [Devosia sp.]